MRLIALFALVLFYTAAPLQAQESDRLESVLQYVIDLPEMEQLFAELGIRNELCLAQTPVLPQEPELVKYGRPIEVHGEEDAFFRCEGYVKFSDVTVSESSGATVSAFVVGPNVRRADDGVDLSIVLQRQSEGWALERFRREE